MTFGIRLCAWEIETCVRGVVCLGRRRLCLERRRVCLGSGVSRKKKSVSRKHNSVSQWAFVRNMQRALRAQGERLGKAQGVCLRKSPGCVSIKRSRCVSRKQQRVHGKRKSAYERHPDRIVSRKKKSVSRKHNRHSPQRAFVRNLQRNFRAQGVCLGHIKVCMGSVEGGERIHPKDARKSG